MHEDTLRLWDLTVGAQISAKVREGRWEGGCVNSGFRVWWSSGVSQQHTRVAQCTVHCYLAVAVQIPAVVRTELEGSNEEVR